MSKFAIGEKVDNAANDHVVGIGTRFKMSVLGAARHPSHAGKEGTIIGGSRYYSSVRVQFDGCKSPTSLHRDYIEIIPTEANSYQTAGASRWSGPKS
jgi:hypothetical protein